MLSEAFSRYGLPKLIVSDNGSQFTSAHFKEFCNGIGHIRRAPQLNEQAERFVDTLKRALKKKGRNHIRITPNIFIGIPNNSK